MPRRIEQVNSHLARELSSLLRREVDFPPGIIVTVTGVEATRDLDHATVRISILPETRAKEILALIVQAKGQLKKALASRTRFHTIPTLHFVIDRTQSTAARIEATLDAVKREEL